MLSCGLFYFPIGPNVCVTIAGHESYHVSLPLALAVVKEARALLALARIVTVLARLALRAPAVIPPCVS